MSYIRIALIDEALPHSGVKLLIHVCVYTHKYVAILSIFSKTLARAKSYKNKVTFSPCKT